ncbi:MAG TPA: ROK family protein [Aggregatilineaceae bacterium]|nr:ROK family protein [Anaerolineae bacterium]HMM26761.1 ROK family protein [Aggregatilineaceae bacterium]
MASENLAIGVDIGGTKIALALVDRSGAVLAERRLPMRPDDATTTLDEIAGAIEALRAGAPGLLAGIGIGCPGHVDPVQGIVHYAVNLGWTGVALRDGIRQRLADDLPVWVHKDTNAAALGELYFGAARGARDFIYLAIGTGLGGAAVVNGALATGLNAYAMEVGHLVLHPQGRQCNCGLRGCVEMYVSGKGLRAGTLEWAVTYPDSPLVERGDRVSAHDILAAFAAGDALAVAVMEQAAEVLGTVMSTCASLLNPERFILGGGLGHAAADFWITRAGAVFRAQVLPAARDGVTIVESTVASSAVGASALVWHARQAV